jgi:hypothetical protein
VLHLVTGVSCQPMRPIAVPPDEWANIEHAVDRHDAAIIEEAATIAQLRRQIALIIEAFEKLDVCKLEGLENYPQGAAARDRYREILQQLKASYAAK